jgi:hypothetical protein
MTTNYHTPIATGAAADAVTFNNPMSELDTQITAVSSEVTTARGTAGSLDARLDAEHNNDGTHSADIIDQAEIDLTSAGSSSGKATRFEEFNLQHNAADGTHKTSVEIITVQAQVNLSTAGISSGDAVRQNEFAAQHVAASGVHNVPQATGTGHAVRWNDWTQEHTDAGDHRSNIIDQAQMALSSAGAATGDAARYDEFSAQHVAATGAHATTGWLTNAMVHTAAAIAGSKITAATIAALGTVELAEDGERTAGLVLQSNDGGLLSATHRTALTDGGITTLHDHEVYQTLYIDHTQGGGNGVEAAALPEYQQNNHGTTGAVEEVKIRFAYFNDGNVDTIRLDFEADLSATPAGSAVARVRLQCDVLNDEETVTWTSWARGGVALDVSSQATGMYEGYVSIIWTNSLDNSDATELYLRRVVIMARERSE